MIGEKFGRLTVLSFEGFNSQGQMYYKCRCECGNEIISIAHNIVREDKNRQCKDCAKAAHGEKCRSIAFMKHEDAKGKRFGNLTVIGLTSSDKSRGVYYICDCDCGTVAVILSSRLKSGHSTKCSSCGKLDFESKTYKVRHGMSHSSTYRIWDGMKRRCNYPKDKSYARYGGSGITVCERWLMSFDNFLEDMGVRPEGLEIDRIDSRGPYSPENCRWVSRQENLKNRTFSSKNKRPVDE